MGAIDEDAPAPLMEGTDMSKRKHKCHHHDRDRFRYRRPGLVRGLLRGLLG